MTELDERNKIIEDFEKENKKEWDELKKQGVKPMRMLDRWKTDGKYYREHAKK